MSATRNGNLPPGSAYLGDQVYVAWDGEQVSLFTYDGMRVLNIIYMEAQQVRNLVDFIDKMPKGSVVVKAINLPG